MCESLSLSAVQLLVFAAVNLPMVALLSVEFVSVGKFMEWFS